MLLKELTELCERLPEGAIVNDRNRYDTGYLQAIVVNFSRRIIKLNYLKNKRINPICYQKYYPSFEKDLQDNLCVVKFRHPEIITFDDMSDGIRYVGPIDYAKAYPRVKSRAWLSTVNQNQVTAVNNDRRATFLYDGNAQILEVYGLPLLKEVMTECIFDNPLDIPTYNIENDQFPMPADMIQDMIQMIYAEQLKIEAAKLISPSDVPNNITNSRK